VRRPEVNYPTFKKISDRAYSISENEGNIGYQPRHDWKEAIKDYNALFDTNFSVETMRALPTERPWMIRLARKQENTSLERNNWISSL